MTALAGRGLTQSPAARAHEVWAQTLREELTGVALDPPLDPFWLKTFSGGVVELLQVPPADFDWTSDFTLATWPSVWQGEDPKLGSSEFPLALTTAAWYKEPLETRQTTEPGIEDLVFYLTAAALSQNELVWKGTWIADPPDAEIQKGGAGFAKRRVDISPVVFDRFFDEDDPDCEAIAAEVQALWAISIEVKTS